ncbi:MAG: hypothetical protein J0I24_14365 [Thiomonas arsenitoxydans]|uniref:Uncharacterized protein n=1 Tax=Thiomonas arsenitoxydans (strain DSM 22701 / CIP 110005 / 3As) TaxID=426114 RepID=A0A8I1MXH4_THIA3|nr:hypothetical protein [Thiomonas arsenitoxydans]MBN8745466.1 hypothetical protein [Thiomonas arsenitoxydans]ODV09428.1 MAG: hypothetical protein ABT20_10880 [Rubrivivax sp. SCN 70-15]
MFTLINTFIATFVGLTHGALVLIGALLGGVAFLIMAIGFLMIGIKGLIDAWFESTEHGRA